MRKYPAIDLLKLYSLGSINGWNDMLTRHYEAEDINGLARIRYQIQAGMDDLAKKKLNDEKMILMFIRLNRSLEITAKKIIRKKFPLESDNMFLENKNSEKYLKTVDAKKKRDKALRDFFRESAY